MKWRKCTGAFLAAAMLFQTTAAYAAPADSAAQTEQLQETLVQNTVLHKTDSGSLYFMEGSCSDGPVEDMKDAESVVDSMAQTLSLDGRIQFEPWRTLEDPAGNHYYVFQQMYADTTVSGGAIKIVTDADNRMTGLISSIVSELPDEDSAEGISAREAERIVKRNAADTEAGDLEILEGYTEKIVLPVNRELDPASEETEESRFVWAVYSYNPDSSVAKSTDLPYLAAYVTTDGEYLYSMPTVLPGDEAGTAGYSASYVFQFMEPAQYTGTVEMSDGTQKEITVDLMQDTRTGMYYLGDIERRIVVADCYDFLYNKGNVILESSPDNTGWDDTSLLSLYNYCKAWDYYNEIGWKGGDGLQTPMIILKDFCDKDHNPIDNAAYAGRYYGWQVFLASDANDLSGCLDVLAHEFTHCVTGSVMTYNAYLNDFGAINEAMSDIQGNLCQMMAGDTEDEEWNLGEGSQMGVIRSMSDPHSHQQPEYSWDVYYVPSVKDGTDMNDRGGVHTNSSLLNNVAYRLCHDGGMTPEEARSFWFAVDCTMVPGTDYEQLKALLPWVLKNIGMQKYEDALAEAIDATKLGSSEMPATLREDQAMVTLKLPDTEQFNDGNWALFIVSVDPQKIEDRFWQILNGEGDYKEAFEELLDIVLGNENGEADRTDPDLLSQLSEWSAKYFGSILHISQGCAGEDGTTIRMVCKPGYTIPLLVRIEMKGDSMVPESLGAAACMFGSWVDLGAAMKNLEGLAEMDLSQDSDPDKVLDQLQDQLGIDLSFEGLMNLLMPDRPMFTQIKEGETCEISADGIEEVEILGKEWIESMDAELKAVETKTEEDAAAGA